MKERRLHLEPTGPAPVQDVLPVHGVRDGSPRVATRLTALAVLLAIAVAGVLVGIVLDRYVLSRPATARVSYGRPNFSLKPPSDADRRAMRDQLARDLGMTADQRRLVDSIMSQRSAHFQTLRDEIRPRVENLIADVRGDIERILTPGQRERFRMLQQQARKSE